MTQFKAFDIFTFPVPRYLFMFRSVVRTPQKEKEDEGGSRSNTNHKIFISP